MDLLSDLLETPEISPKRVRVAAAIVDFLIIWIIGFGLGLLFGQSRTGISGETGYFFSIHLTGIPAILFFLSWIGLMPVMEGMTGKTIGKRVMKIKVVKEDFTDTTIGRSLARHLFDSIDCFFLIGLIVASTNKKNQRIGDLVAKTLVVRG
ncbi:MAG: RDD family protein [Puia sp.]|nr:RDD family protein [Puia sp.]